MSQEAEGLSRVGALIANDAFAISYQSLGQYRSALLRAVVEELEKPTWQGVDLASGNDRSGWVVYEGGQLLFAAQCEPCYRLFELSRLQGRPYKGKGCDCGVSRDA